MVDYSVVEDFVLKPFEDATWFLSPGGCVFGRDAAKDLVVHLDALVAVQEAL